MNCGRTVLIASPGAAHDLLLLLPFVTHASTHPLLVLAIPALVFLESQVVFSHPEISRNCYGR